MNRKIDGELRLAEMPKGKANLFACGREGLDQRPLVEVLTALAEGCNQPLMMAGELHGRASGDGRERVGDVAAAMAAGDQHRLACAAFDGVKLDGTPPQANYHPRLELLQSLLAKAAAPQLAVVPTKEMREPAGLRPHVERWLESGNAEVWVVRSSTIEIDKLKPSFSLDAVVVGFTTRVHEADRVHAVLLGLQRSDGNLYRFVNPELVLELSCTDLQMEDSSDEPVRRWVLRNSGGWQPVVDAIAASMIHPVVVRRRTDKKADALEGRLNQLQEHLAGLDPEVPLILRQLLVWESDKQGAWPDWPVWMEHFTDYSPEHKTPVDGMIRAAMSESGDQAIGDAWSPGTTKRAGRRWPPKRMMNLHLNQSRDPAPNPLSRPLVGQKLASPEPNPEFNRLRGLLTCLRRNDTRKANALNA